MRWGSRIVLLVVAAFAAVLVVPPVAASPTDLGAAEPAGAPVRTNLGLDGVDAGGQAVEQDDGSVLFLGPLVTRHLSSGAFDTAFGDRGVLDTRPNDSSGTPVATATGRITTIDAYDTNAPKAVTLRRFDRTGKADAAFGTAGVARFSLTNSAITRRLVAADDGIVYVVVQDGGSDLAALAVTNAGVGLSTFGSAGFLRLTGANQRDAVAAAGTRLVVARPPTGEHLRRDLVAIGRNGAVDATWGSAGTTTIPSEVNRLTSSGGKLIVRADQTRIVDAATGALDPTFAYTGPGDVLARRGSGWVAIADTTYLDGTGTTQYGTRARALTASGAADTAVGTDGTVAAIEPQARFVRAAWLPTAQRLALTREGARQPSLRWLKVDGTPDTAREGSSHGNEVAPSPGSDDHVDQVLQTADGVYVLSKGYGYGRVVRLKPDGSVDTAFGTGGVLFIPFDTLGDSSYTPTITALGTSIGLLVEGPRVVRFDAAGAFLPGFGADARRLNLYGAQGLVRLADGRVRTFGQDHVGVGFYDIATDGSQAPPPVAGRNVTPTPGVTSNVVGLSFRPDGGADFALVGGFEGPVALLTADASGVTTSTLHLPIDSTRSPMALARRGADLYVAGQSCDLDDGGGFCAQARAVVVRLTDGEPVFSFGRQGLASGHAVRGYRRTTVTVDPIGRVLVGTADQVTRFDPDGRPDPSFGHSGSVVLPTRALSHGGEIVQTASALLQLTDHLPSDDHPIGSGSDLVVQRLVGGGLGDRPAPFVQRAEEVRYEQFNLIESNGTTWEPLTAAAGGFATTVHGDRDGIAVVRASADLWTATAGVNQDLAVFVSDNGGPAQLVAWKESGGFAGTYSPNAAAISTTFPVTWAHQYEVSLRWKANRKVPGSRIFAGAGSAGAYSPTSLTVEVVDSTTGAIAAATSAQQVSLPAGTSWVPVPDGPSVVVPADHPTGTALLTANADLWTSTAGVNQNLAIAVERQVDGGAWQPEEIVAWKESGGFAGTYSPNAATVEVPITCHAGTAYRISLRLRANRYVQDGRIWVGAGSPGAFSPTTLVVNQLDPTVAAVDAAVSTDQQQLDGSDGETWELLDPSTTLFLDPVQETEVELRANADLWTATAGVNQDLGIAVVADDGSIEDVVGWKESGGYGGTYSPNAASVRATIRVQPGVSYFVALVWKANRPVPGSAIFVGAGPGGAHSPTVLIARELTPG